MGSDGVEARRLRLAGGDSAKKKGVGELRNAGGTPDIILFKTRPERGLTKLPNGEIESKSWNDEGGGGVSQEGKGERKKKGGGRRGRTGRKKRRKGRKKIELREEDLTGRVNNRAVGVDVNNGVFRRGAKEAAGGLRNSEVELVAHTTGSSKGVVDKTEVVEDEVRRASARGESEGFRDRVDAGSRSRGKKSGVGFSEREENLLTTMSGGLRKEDVVDEGLVDGRAGRFGKRGKGTIGKMAITPEIDSSSAAVVLDKLTGLEAEGRKSVVVGGGVD